jgi:hypothetical protein
VTTCTERNIRIEFPDALSCRKFDDRRIHGLLDVMKAVDFIIELADRYLFVEVKDPQAPGADVRRSATFISEFLTGELDESLKYKYRDSFLYEWASGRADKPIYYLVLIAVDSLSEADLLARTDSLQRKLPQRGPTNGAWRNDIVAGCVVMNLAAWNDQLPNYPVSRVAP